MHIERYCWLEDAYVNRVRTVCLRLAFCSHVSLSVPTYRSLCLRIALYLRIALRI